MSGFGLSYVMWCKFIDTDCNGKAIPVQAYFSPKESKISRKSARESGKVVSPTHRPPLPLENIPGTHFC